VENKKASTKIALADISNFNPSRVAVVYWVSKLNDPSPIQAAADWLKQAK
jgi:hypothetical protein